MESDHVPRRITRKAQRTEGIPKMASSLETAEVVVSSAQNENKVSEESSIITGNKLSHLSERIEKIDEDCVRARDENKSLRETVATLKIEIQKVHKQNEALEERDRRRELEMAEIRAMVSEMSEKLAKQSERVDQISCESVVEQIVEQRNELQKEAEKILVGKQKIEEEVVEINKKFSECRDQIDVSFAEIMKKEKELSIEANRAKKGNKIEEEVKRVIRSNEKLLRETVDKSKSLIIFGNKENEIESRVNRDKEEDKFVKDVIGELMVYNVDKEIAEFRRIGKYEKDKVRPLKVTFMNSQVLEEVLRNAWKLKDSEKYSGLMIRRDLSKEDREVLKGKLEEAKAKNNERSEDEAKTFFFKVVGLRIVKWYLKK